MVPTAPNKPTVVRVRPSLRNHSVSIEPCNTHGNPLQKPISNTTRKRRSSRSRKGGHFLVEAEFTD